jgi:thioredoxin 1
MTKPIAVSDSDFGQMVLQAKAPVLVDFWATWCAPCRMVAPVIDELAEEYDGRVSFVKLDVDQNPETASKYSIMSIPTLLIFKEGKPVAHMVGFRPKDEIKRSLDEALG